MRKFLVAATAAFLLGGCGAVLPKPETAKQAGIEALVAYGLAAHVANQYLGSPVCTAPVTVVPCKNTTVAAQLKALDNTAFAAANAAHNAVNDPNFSASKLDALAISAKEALTLLNAYIASQAVQSTLGGK